MAKKESKGIGLVSAPMSRGMQAQERRWRAESDLRTLRDAEQIRHDAGRVRMARQLAKEEMRALSRVSKGKR